MSKFNKLYEVVQKTFSNRYIITKNNTSITLSTKEDKFSSTIHYINNSYLLSMDHLEELMAALNIKINPKSYNYFIQKYSDICFKYGVFSSIRERKKVAGLSLEDFVLKTKGIIVPLQYYCDLEVKNYSNLNLRLYLDENLVPEFELFVPITPFRKIYVRVNMKFNQENLDKELNKLEKKIKNQAFNIIQANFKQFSKEDLKKMPDEDLKQYLTLCKILKY